MRQNTAGLTTDMIHAIPASGSAARNVLSPYMGSQVSSNYMGGGLQSYYGGGLVSGGGRSRRMSRMRDFAGLGLVSGGSRGGGLQSYYGGNIGGLYGGAYSLNEYGKRRATGLSASEAKASILRDLGIDIDSVCPKVKRSNKRYAPSAAALARREIRREQKSASASARALGRREASILKQQTKTGLPIVVLEAMRERKNAKAREYAKKYRATKRAMRGAVPGDVIPRGSGLVSGGRRRLRL